MTDNGDSNVAAFFDLDLTITSCDSFRLFLKEEYIYSIKNWKFLPYLFICGTMRKLNVISLQQFKEFSLMSMRGKTKEEIIEEGKKFFLISLLNQIRPKASELILKHKDKKHKVFILSASPDIYVHAVTTHLNLDGYECSRLLYSNNCFTGKFEGNDLIGKYKFQRMKLIENKYQIDLSKSYAYSDHESDLPMLKSVGNPVAISPTEQLKKIARYNGWEIIF